MPMCLICNHDDDSPRIHRVKEQMFGLDESFDYRECSSCGSLQLLNVPSDMNRYYPDNYYSLNPRMASAKTRFLNKICVLPFGNSLYRFRNQPYCSLFRMGLRKNWRILDVGCGAGELLHELRLAGCTKLFGVDPFGPETNNSIRIYRKTVFDVNEQFTLVILNHALEHMTDPEKTLRHLRAITLEGRCLIRIPVIGEAWRQQGPQWVELDAPRHLFIYSEAGFRQLAKRCGFNVYHVDYDSTDFQFTAYRQYPTDQIQMFRKWAKDLNKRNMGDTAAFYLR